MSGYQRAGVLAFAWKSLQAGVRRGLARAPWKVGRGSEVKGWDLGPAEAARGLEAHPFPLAGARSLRAAEAHLGGNPTLEPARRDTDWGRQASLPKQLPPGTSFFPALGAPRG